MTDVTHSGMAKYVLGTESHEENENKDALNDGNNTQEHSRKASQASQASPPDPKPRPQTTCPNCGTTGDAFRMKIHIKNCEGEGTG